MFLPLSLGGSRSLTAAGRRIPLLCDGGEERLHCLTLKRCGEGRLAPPTFVYWNAAREEMRRGKRPWRHMVSHRRNRSQRNASGNFSSGEEKGHLVVPRIVTTADWGPMDESVDAAGDLRFSSGPPLSAGVSATLPSERRRSLSGGAHRLPALQLSSRARRQSGDDVLGGVSPSRKAVLFDAFRPRSKSDSKGSSSSGSRKPNNLMSALRGHSWFPGSRSALTPPNGAAGGGASAPMSPLSPLSPVDSEAPFRRPRSGSESRTGAVSKVMDLFRSRSQSVSVEGKAKKFPVSSSQYAGPDPTRVHRSSAAARAPVASLLALRGCWAARSFAASRGIRVVAVSSRRQGLWRAAAFSDVAIVRARSWLFACARYAAAALNESGEEFLTAAGASVFGVVKSWRSPSELCGTLSQQLRLVAERGPGAADALSPMAR
ncbi:hypothetical protein HPB49_023946 [Dermacentor silvarum]|uniref:Uncharacterized protein n=1 Tax=Dermacentor silvarum TaxID=543639 RepID=A0ACB8DH11_DERSI|nr:hypothetical protein HPB49_023946 [Dermacentor silvarum]